MGCIKIKWLILEIDGFNVHKFILTFVTNGKSPSKYVDLSLTSFVEGTKMQIG